MKIKELRDNLNVFKHGISFAINELAKLEDWYSFLFEGRWQTALPDRKGFYVVRNKGVSTSVVFVDSDITMPEREGFYWWSEPFPDNFGLPKIEEEL